MGTAQQAGQRFRSPGEAVILIEHKFICDACGTESASAHRHFLENEMLRPTLPQNWHHFEGAFFCDKHVILARVCKAKPGEHGVMWLRPAARKGVR
jgi:hypothetical protein